MTRNTLQRPTYRAHERLLQGAWRARYVMALDLAVVEDQVLSLVHRLRAYREGSTTLASIPTQRRPLG